MNHTIKTLSKTIMLKHFAKVILCPFPPGTMSGGYKFNTGRDYLLPFQQRLLTLTGNQWQQNPGW